MEQQKDPIQNESLASDLIYDRMCSFAKDQQLHIFPSSIDGLISATRRIIWACKKYSDKITSYTSLVAETRKLHNHGDGSIKNTIDVHAQDWKTPIPIITVKGNKGSYSGDEAAASRYLEGYLSDETMYVYIDNINTKTLKVVPAESGEGLEPEYLIPIIPAGLVNNDKTIAPGYKFSNIPINISAMCDLVIEYINIRKQVNGSPLKRRGVLKKLSKYLLPDFPVPGLLRNFNELMAEYDSGNYNCPVILDGEIEVTPNKVIVVTSQTQTMVNRREKIELHEMPNSNSFLAKHCTEFKPLDKKDSLYCEHTFFLKRGVDPFLIVEYVKNFYGFGAAIKPHRNFLNKFMMRQEMSQLEILETWYEIRHENVIKQLKLKQLDQLAYIRKLEALIVHIEHSKEITGIFESSLNIDEAINKLAERFKQLSRHQIQFLTEIKHKDLVKLSKDQIRQDIDKAFDDLKKINDQLLDVDSVIVSDVIEYKKKFHPDTLKKSVHFRKHNLGKYKRYIQLPNFMCICNIRDIGYIQCRTWDEVNDIIVLNNYQVDIILYPESNNQLYNYYIDLENKIRADEYIDFSQIFSGKKFCSSKDRLHNTVVLTDNNKMYVKNGLYIPKESSEKYYFVNDTYRALYRDGAVSIESVSQEQRKLLSDIIYVSNNTSKYCIVIYMSPVSPGLVCMEKLTTNNVNYFDVKTTEILYVGDDNQVFLNLPRNCIHKHKERYILLDNICKLFERNIKVDFQVNQPSFNNVEYTVTMNRHIKTITFK